MAERVRLLAVWAAAALALLLLCIVVGGYIWLVADLTPADGDLLAAAMEDVSTTLWLLLAALIGAPMVPSVGRQVSAFTRSFRSRHDS